MNTIGQAVVAPLELFARGPLNLRHEYISIPKGYPASTLLYISDIHLGAANSQKLVTDLINIASTQAPAAILLGGDLVDRRKHLPHLSHLIDSLLTIAPTAAIPGNHDVVVGLEEVRACILQSGATWLPDKPLFLPEYKVVVEGAGVQSSIPELTRVLCLHNPSDFESPSARSYPLVLAGHLHGSQIVLKQHRQALYPGRLFFRWNILRHDTDTSTLLVSRGANDTLPVRFNCPREVILCHLG